MKMNTLKAKIVERNTNISAVAKALGLSKSTFYRRLKNEGRDFSVEEVKKISNYLNLTAKEATNIFFLTKNRINATNKRRTHENARITNF